jgi:hypothetical protein
MSKFHNFRVGDIVIINKNNSLSYNSIGDIGRITGITDDVTDPNARMRLEQCFARIAVEGKRCVTGNWSFISEISLFKKNIKLSNQITIL